VIPAAIHAALTALAFSLGWRLASRRRRRPEPAAPVSASAGRPSLFVLEELNRVGGGQVFAQLERQLDEIRALPEVER
jgi:hypothetical protein